MPRVLTPEQRECKNAKERQRMQNNADARQRAVERNRAWRARNPSEHRDRTYRRKYGIGVAEWEEMFSAQDRKCAVCRADEPGHSWGWTTDHCHRSGRVRGILCHGCNVALGAVSDDPQRLQSLILYLEKQDVPTPVLKFNC